MLPPQTRWQWSGWLTRCSPGWAFVHFGYLCILCINWALGQGSIHTSIFLTTICRIIAEPTSNSYKRIGISVYELKHFKSPGRNPSVKGSAQIFQEPSVRGWLGATRCRWYVASPEGEGGPIQWKRWWGWWTWKVYMCVRLICKKMRQILKIFIP